MIYKIRPCIPSSTTDLSFFILILIVITIIAFSGFLLFHLVFLPYFLSIVLFQFSIDIIVSIHCLAKFNIIMKFIVGTQLIAVLAAVASGVQGYANMNPTGRADLFSSCRSLLTPIFLSAPATDGTANAALEPRAKNEDKCGPSTFDSLWNPNGAPVERCLQVAANVIRGGVWTIHWPGIQRIKTEGCTFFVRPESAGFTNVGNEDVRSIIFSALEMFQRDGRVGAYGSMKCKPNGHTVVWELRNNETESHWGF